MDRSQGKHRSTPQDKNGKRNKEHGEKKEMGHLMRNEKF